MNHLLDISMPIVLFRPFVNFCVDSLFLLFRFVPLQTKIIHNVDTKMFSFLFFIMCYLKKNVSSNISSTFLSTGKYALLCFIVFLVKVFILTVILFFI